MKKYLIWTDYVVLCALVVSLVWTILYKLVWIDEELIFNNADRWGDIAYTIFASIIASCIFYIVTILLYRCYRIEKMTKGLAYYLLAIEKIYGRLFTYFPRVDGEGTYMKNIEELLLKNGYNNIHILDDYFTPLFMKSFILNGNRDILNQYIKGLMIIINTIEKLYADILPLDFSELTNQIRTFTYPDNGNIIELELDEYKDFFIRIIAISFILKKKYNVEIDENKLRNT